MVIASNGRAFGAAEKDVAVKNRCWYRLPCPA